MSIKSLIRTIPDYPRRGIQFRDITTLLQDAGGMRDAVDKMAEPFKGERVDKVAGIEARGFILGGAVAANVVIGMVVDAAGWDASFAVIVAACILAIILISFTWRAEKGVSSLNRSPDQT